MYKIYCDLQELLGMSKEEFQQLPIWRQVNLKKDIGLFWWIILTAFSSSCHCKIFEFLLIVHNIYNLKIRKKFQFLSVFFSKLFTYL